MLLGSDLLELIGTLDDPEPPPGAEDGEDTGDAPSTTEEPAPSR